MFVQLIYISEAVGEELSPEFIREAQERNKKVGVSGVIVSTPKVYLQLIEGERTAVNRLYSRILKDYRHTNLVILRYVEIRRREFSEQLMVHLEVQDLLENVISVNRLSMQLDPEHITGVEALGLMRRIAAVMKAVHDGNNTPKWITNLEKTLVDVQKSEGPK